MNKCWLKQYQDCIPETISVNINENLNTLFDDACISYASKTALMNMGSTMTYQELHQHAIQLAAFFQSKGLERGTRIALMMPNIMQYPISLFATLKAGMVVVNVNPLYTTDELVHQINDSGAEVLIVLANFIDTVAMGLKRMPSLKQVVITQVGDMFSMPKRIMMNAMLRYVKKMVPATEIKNSISFLDAISIGKKKTFSPVTIQSDDVAFLQYTGGTTGISKGAMLTHHNLMSNIAQASAWIMPLFDGRQEIIVTALPLYHIFSLTANLLTFMKAGACNVLITNPKNVQQFIKDIKDIKFTAFTGVNTLFNSLLNDKAFTSIDFSALKLALSGGMALQKSVAIRWKEITGRPVLEAYGLTETSPAVTINPVHLNDYNGSVGLPLPSTEISIRDDNNQEVAFGESGELCIKGPQVMAGYWQRPDETAKVMTDDGYLKTGDVARMDEHGFIYLVDRKKDMIVISGFNVYPNDIEQVIGLHPWVLEVGVCGIEDEHAGEKVVACIVKKDARLDEAAIIAHCREHLTGYKIPRKVVFFDELPKSNVGKILRRDLKCMLLSAEFA